MNNSKLKLKLEATFSGVVGYGNVYKCSIIEVLHGEIDDKTISLTILSSDQYILNSVSSNFPIEVIVDFKKNKINEPYAIMPISGMVDKDKTSWIITEMELSK